MKKVLLALLLLVLIIAVSYLKTAREHDRSRAYFEEGRLNAAGDLDKYEKQAESLKLTVAEQQLAFADSLVRKDISYQSRIDSLETLADRQQNRIDSLSGKIVTSATASEAKSSSESQLSKHEQILKYYKKRYANLPEDLSTYERRIAIDEIREETSQKFAISLQELKKIRDKYKLTY
jgi:hypothetical protein